MVANFFCGNCCRDFLICTAKQDTGSDEYNLQLSRRRAESVQDYLTKYAGLNIGRIITQWYGKKDPIASDSTEDGQQQNRRVESIVMGLD